MGKVIMLDVLSVFEELSSDSKLDRQGLAEKFKFLPVSVQKAFENQDSKMIKTTCSFKKVFSDFTAVFNLV